MIQRSVFTVFFVLIVFSGVELQADMRPKSLATDARIKQVAYDPNQVYNVVGVYGYQTSIEFAPNEVVKLLTIGDSIAWQPASYQNRIFLKPVEPNASTNLTVLTDKRAYYFNLSSTQNKKAATYLIRFVYPGESLYIESIAPSSDSSAQGFDPTTLNYNYQVSGDRKAVLLNKIFDDGKFTYFFFNDGAEIPTIYTVMADKTESLVNTRRQGNLLVVERLSDKFTLRLGNSYLCVRQKKDRLSASNTRNGR